MQTSPPAPIAREPATGPGRRPPARLLLYVAGAVLLLSTWAIELLSRQFVFGQNYLARPVVAFVAVYLVAWLAYAAAFHAVRTTVWDRRLLIWVGVVAVAARLLLLLSDPILESDFYRYIWDGQVVAAGGNPYAAAPAEQTPAALFGAADLGRAELVHQRISYPEVGTIYPPGAQAVFVVNAWISGWHPYGFRLILLFVDLAFMLLLWFGFERQGALARCLLYAWNPLVLKEAFNGMHLDLVCAFLLLACLQALGRRRWRLAYTWVLLAAAVKITPVVLLPLFVGCAGRRRDWPLLGFVAAATAVAAAVAVLPMVAGAGQGGAGLTTFYTWWQVNGSLHPLLSAWLGLWSSDPQWCSEWARRLLLTGYGLGLLMLAAGCRTPDQLARRSMWALLALFLVAPVANPWYLLWLLPWLVCARAVVPLALMIATSLYYVSFYLIYRDAGRGAHVWLQVSEYLPFYVFLLHWLHRRRPSWTRDSSQSQS